MRTFLRGKVTLLFMMLGMLVAVPAVALAADLQTDAILSTNAATPTYVKVGDNSFQIKVWATGNLPDNRPGTAQIVNKYNMNTSGSIAADTTSQTTITFADNFNYSNDCAANPIQGCPSNPFVVNATLNVAAGTEDGKTGLLTVSNTGSQSLGADSTPDTGNVKVDAANPTVTLTTPADEAEYTQGDSVLADYTCADSGSGIKDDINTSATIEGCVGDVNSGSAIDTATLGSKSFTVTATDNVGNVTTVIHNYTVVPANQAPVASSQTVNINEDNPGELITLSASDDDGDALTYKLTSLPTNGKLYQGTTEITSASAANPFSLSGNQVTYKPNTNYFGPDSFDFKVNDGTVDSNVVTVTINIAPVNDPPTDPGAITVSPASAAPLNKTGAFTLNWGESSDVDSSFTYTLEKKDSDDGTAWTTVKSGLTSPSYTFGGSNPGGNPAESEGFWDYRVKAVDNDSTPASSGYSTANDLVKVDKTGPNVSGTITSTPHTVGSVTWYKDSAVVDWSATDPNLADGSAGSGVVEQPSDATLNEGWNQTSNVPSVSDQAGNPGSGNAVTGINVDAGAPNVSASITSTPAYNDGTNDWYKDSVSIDVSASDPNLSDGHAGSGLATDPSGTENRTSSGSYFATATDNVGHSTDSNTVSFKVDSLAPTVSLDCSQLPATIYKGDTVSLPWTASDESGGSGVASPTTGTLSLSTSTVGSQTAKVAAGATKDNVGHNSQESNSCSYSVIYKWDGFFSPVDNLPTLNLVKGGSSVPMKFNLGGNQGMGILAAGYPKSISIPCDSTAELDALETVATAGSSGLNFDSTTNQYNYIWKTDKAWTSGCRQVEVKLIDGTSHRANFKFSK